MKLVSDCCGSKTTKCECDRCNDPICLECLEHCTLVDKEEYKETHQEPFIDPNQLNLFPDALDKQDTNIS